jgi:hypothetical protein
MNSTNQVAAQLMLQRQPLPLTHDIPDWNFSVLCRTVGATEFNLYHVSAPNLIYLVFSNGQFNN